MQIFASRYLLPIGAPPREDGALLVENGRIVAVAPRRELAAAHPRAAAVDFGEAVLLPPLVNAHTHLELSDFPQWAEAAGEAGEPDDFVDWILRLVRVRRTLDAAAVQASLAEGLRQSLAAGTGAVGDILTDLTALPAYAGTPLSGRVFAEVLGVDAARVAARLAEIAARLTTPPGPALRWGLSPHAPYTLTAATLAQVIAFARAHQLPLAMHWAETAEEIAFLSKGQGPLAERLYPAAGWSLPANPYLPKPESLSGLLIHGTHLTAAEIAAIARTGLGVVLCPRSNRRFGEQRAPLAALRRAGVPLALGTDSRASSPSLSVWDELAFAREWFAGDLDPAAWLEIATMGGARALGLGGELGRLSPGMAASFQVLAVPPGATVATLAEALCAEGQRTLPRALYLRGENVLPHP